MEAVIPDTEYQAFQQFISSSPWDAQDVIDVSALRSSKLIGDPKNARLISGKTSFIKKGKKTIGLAGQYLGFKGKVENWHWQ